VLTVVALVAAGALVFRSLPKLDDLVPVIRMADLGWLLVALLAELVSMRMFARQQWWLLRGFGVTLSIWRSLAVTYGRSAIAISMPAGSAVSAGFAFKAFRKSGASTGVATTVLLLSGVLSAAGLALLYLFGFTALLAAHPQETWRDHPIGTVAAVTLLVVLVLFAVWEATSPSRPAVEADEPPSGWKANARHALAATVTLPTRYRRGALGFAMVNWLADLCCLAAVAQAFHLPLTFFEVGTAYVVVQLVRQIPVTPGGMGVIEASLLAALITAGASEAPAAAAVLGYRLFSCWLVIPVGLAAAALLRTSFGTATRPSGHSAERRTAAHPDC
jgi:uncharacterized membrane protein YbhN (UPF0104 family)